MSRTNEDIHEAFWNIERAVETNKLTELRQYIADRQQDDWHRLDAAIRRAINGVWSIECGDILNTIRRGMRITGPSEPSEIPWLFSTSGIYSLVTGVDVTEFIDQYSAMMAPHTKVPMNLSQTLVCVKSQMEEEIED